MSSNLMETGGQQSHYEDEATQVQPPNKSTGQLGNPSEHTTSDPSKTTDAQRQQAERGAQTAENMRYGQTISEGGMGGMTNVQHDEVQNEGVGRQAGKDTDADAARDRKVEGYGGEKDMDKEIGA